MDLGIGELPIVGLTGADLPAGVELWVAGMLVAAVADIMVGTGLMAADLMAAVAGNLVKIC